ncbi:LacI family DNA-binding transcriptional regulator [Vagococcus luciliae]|uniref:HTH-type transcriptional regulator MalR n=1 Tax=Vagococcus luciliae TaxID=2920380 RepID=A0ABY5NZ01_9ENTE|nr:LacI family DNA-binding transcriptional regulator [Vagococcus luciliae]UUV98728.1 HTH-type transcriptional regulator MalR [Vagococcus luciliae]
MGVTIKDVAKEVGVAPSTVSRVLKDHPSISSETKERVRKAMDKLGYVPNIAARNLVSKLSNAIGVVLPIIESKERASEPFYLEAITAMNEEASNHQVSIAIASGNTELELLEAVQLLFLQKRVDSFILMYVKENDLILDFLIEKNIPFTIIGHPYRYYNETSCVDNDNQLLGRSVTQYLIDKGHKDILFVTNNATENFFKERFYGYESCLKENNLTCYPVCDLEKTNEFIQLDSLLRERKISACIAIDDMFALKVIQFIQLSGLVVPDDVSVISFNNSIFSTLIHPYITSVDINTNELAKSAVLECLNQVKHPEELKKRVIIPHQLIERETVIEH